MRAEPALTVLASSTAATLVADTAMIAAPPAPLMPTAKELTYWLAVTSSSVVTRKAPPALMVAP